MIIEIVPIRLGWENERGRRVPFRAKGKRDGWRLVNGGYRLRLQDGTFAAASYRTLYEAQAEACRINRG